MTKGEADALKATIDRGYYDRKDYPPFALDAVTDRNRFRAYVFTVIDERVAEPELERHAHG